MNPVLGVKQRLNAETRYLDHFSYGTFDAETVHTVWLCNFSKSAGLFVPMAKPAYHQFLTTAEMIELCIYYHSDLGCVWKQDGEYYWMKSIFTRGNQRAESDWYELMVEGADPLSAINALRL